MKDNILSALSSIWGNKVRSFLTLLGVVIGVSSVTILISLGQGLKNDVSNLIQGFGTNVIVTLSGQVNPEGGQQSQNPANFLTLDILTEKDTRDIQSLDDVTVAAALSPVAGNLKFEDKMASPAIFGSQPNVIKAFETLKIDEGRMFKADDGNVIVLGSAPTTQLFGEEVDPIGEKILLGKDEFLIVGSFKKPKTTALIGSELANMSMIPFNTATKLNNGNVKIVRIVSKARDDADVNKVKDEIFDTLLANHDGEEDFTVLTQEDLLGLFNRFLNLATSMVSAIASISLVVGGIGIMNIMFVTVSERTREIGIRKAVGATKGAILVQFLTEAVVVTLVGGIIGLGIAYGVGEIVAANSQLRPAITADVILLAVGISSAIGLIFGLWPAIRAARKDPIEALRYE